VTSPKARGLIAHELVHAVQQRTLGLSLPSPSSEHGQALEAEAVAAERFYAGESATPQPLIHAPRNPPAAPVADTYAQLAPTATVATTTPAVTPPTQPQSQQQPVIDSRVRQEVDRVATETARRVVEQEWQNPSLTPQQRQALGLPPQEQDQQDQPDPTAGFLEAAVLSRLRPSRMRHAPPAPSDPLHPSQPQHGPLSQTTATTVPAQTPQGATPQLQQQQQDQPPVDSTAGFLEAAVLGRLSHHGHHLHRDTAQQQSQTPQQQQAHQPSQPQSQALTQHTASTAAATTDATTDAAAHHRVDINDLDLEELSARLYSRLRSRLRLELLVDRERAGQLTDYR
jgi:hypothetical protein